MRYFGMETAVIKYAKGEILPPNSTWKDQEKILQKNLKDHKQFLEKHYIKQCGDAWLINDYIYFKVNAFGSIENTKMKIKQKGIRLHERKG